MKTIEIYVAVALPFSGVSNWIESNKPKLRIRKLPNMYSSRERTQSSILDEVTLQLNEIAKSEENRENIPSKIFVNFNFETTESLAEIMNIFLKFKKEYNERVFKKDQIVFSFEIQKFGDDKNNKINCLLNSIKNSRFEETLLDFDDFMECKNLDFDIEKLKMMFPEEKINICLKNVDSPSDDWLFVKAIGNGMEISGDWSDNVVQYLDYHEDFGQKILAPQIVTLCDKFAKNITIVDYVKLVSSVVQCEKQNDYDMSFICYQVKMSQALKFLDAHGYLKQDDVRKELKNIILKK